MTCPAPHRRNLVLEDFGLSLDALVSVAGGVRWQWTMGRLGGWPGTGGGVPLCCPAWLALDIGAMSHASGSGGERGRGVDLGTVGCRGAGNQGSHQMAPSSEKLAAGPHLQALWV